MTLDWFLVQAISGVINTLLPAILLAAGVWLLLSSIRNLNAATRYAAWWAVALAILCLPLLRVPPESKAENTLEGTATPVEHHIDLPAHAPPPVEHLASPPELASAWTLPFQFPAGKAALLLGAIWAAGALAGLVRLLLSYLDLRGILRRARPLDPALLTRWTQHFGIRRPVRLLSSDEIDSPLAAGFRQPAVLVPESLLSRLNDHLADHVVIHELAHLGRRDDWANLLGRLLEAAFWFHPVARFILRRLEFERELACDDWVVAAAPSRRSYASSLTRLAEWRMDGASHPLAASMVGRGSQVARRVRSLLDPRRNSAIRVFPGVFLFAVMAIGALLLGAAQTPGLVTFADDQEVAAAPPAPQAPQSPVSQPPVSQPPAPPAPRSPAPGSPAQGSPAPRTPTPRTPPTPPSPIAVQAPAPVPLPTPGVAPMPAPFPVPVPSPAPVAPSAGPPTPPQPPQPSAPGFLAALAQAGYGNLEVDEIVEMKVHGITPDFIRQMSAAGFGKLTSRQLVELRVHGVTPGYLAELQKAGIAAYTFEQAKELRIHGVRPAEVAAIHALGFGPYNAREVADLRIHGVREEFFRALKENGFANSSHHDILEARIHGVSADHLRQAKKYGQGKDLRRVIKLKQAGVL